MFQRIAGIIVGGIVTLLLLILFDDGRIVSDQFSGFFVAVVIGAAVNLVWPLIWSTFTSRRAREHRDATVRAEVHRQVESQRPVEE